MASTPHTQPHTQLAIIDGPIPKDQWSPQALLRDEHGAVASFIGVVRNEHGGKGVRGIDYECHRPLALNVLGELASILRRDHGEDLGLIMVHGTHSMVPGDAAVIIHVSSPHRRAALSACHDAIERIKCDLPVWKHEHYEDGSSEWLPGS